MKIQEVILLTRRIRVELFGRLFSIRVEHDNKIIEGRIFLQITYFDRCRTTGELKEWHGRKWYLSDHMTPDEIVKTAYAAFKAAVEHEIMEGFTVDGRVLFNPHVSFEALLSVSNQEVRRESEPKKEMRFGQSNADYNQTGF